MGSDVKQDWYQPVCDTLSLGDLVGVAPYGIIDTPLTVCQPVNKDPKGKALYYPLDELPKHKDHQFLHARGQAGIGLVIWPDCQIDKLKNQGRPEDKWFAAIAPVHPLSKVAEAVRPSVLNFDRAQFFPLPAHPPVLAEDSYADLRYIWPVRYALLSNRILTLTEAARNALALHRFWFDTGMQIEVAPPCERCGRVLVSHADREEE